MAGIGFELRKILKKDSYWSLLKAYAYAGVISSGPWVLSIIGLLIIGVLSISVVAPESLIIQFQLSVTYLIAVSLILTGCLQTSFTRFVADRLYEEKDELILSNFNGVLCLVTIVCGIFATGLIVWLFPHQSILYKVLMVGCFVVLGNIWIATIFLSSMKEYQAVLLLYAIGYGLTIGASLLLRSYGLEGLLLGFFIGQFGILIGMLGLTVRNYSSETLLAWDFLKKGQMYGSLIWLGLVYNLAIWIDKFLFWYYPETSELVLGPIRNSPIYDLPIFLAYLSILPGMASFLVRMETDFVERYQEFYGAIREGASLDFIQHAKNEMIRTIRLGLYEIMKIQFVVSLLIWAVGPPVLRWLEISELYESLLYVDIVAAGLQVLFLGILNVFFYLDKRMIALGLSSLFLFGNVILSAWSLHMGLPYYGYGFAVSLLVVVIFGMHLLDKKLQNLEYETFMLQ